MCCCKVTSTCTKSCAIVKTKIQTHVQYEYRHQDKKLSSTRQPCEFSVIRSGTPGALVSPTGPIQSGQNCCCDLIGYVLDGNNDKYKWTTWPTLLLQRSRFLFFICWFNDKKANPKSYTPRLVTTFMFLFITECLFNQMKERQKTLFSS